ELAKYLLVREYCLRRLFLGSAGCRVAHASRVLVSASRRNNLCDNTKLESKVRDGGTPSPARETRALPGSLRSSEQESREREIGIDLLRQIGNDSIFQS